MRREDYATCACDAITGTVEFLVEPNDALGYEVDSFEPHLRKAA